MELGQYILLPKNTALTVTGIQHEKKKGRDIQLSKYKVLNIYWEECYYPYPHSHKRIELKKETGKVIYVKYLESVQEILLELKN
jgi:hypothetical protein